VRVFSLKDRNDIHLECTYHSNNKYRLVSVCWDHYEDTIWSGSEDIVYGWNRNQNSYFSPKIVYIFS
jgi:hypothetical protein